MAKVVITGAEEIRRNLKAAQDDIKKGVLAGMVKGAILVRRDMETIPWVTPVDLSNLRHSFFITTVLSDRRPNRLLTPKSGKKADLKKAAEVDMETNIAMMKAKANVIAATNLTLIMGYGASYAIWVHEMEKKNDWTDPMSGPKWFEDALKRNKVNIYNLMGNSVKSITSTKHFARTKTKAAHTDVTNVDDIDTGTFLGKSDQEK